MYINKYIYICVCILRKLFIYLLAPWSSPWEANMFSTSQEISRILWKGSLPHLNDPTTVPNLSQLDPAHTPTSHFLKILLILSSHLLLGPSSGLFHSGFPTRTLYVPLLFPVRTTCPTYLSSRFYHPNNIEWRVHIIKFLTVVISPFPCYFLSLGRNSFLTTLSLRSSLNVSDQVSHPYKTTGKIIFLYILFLDSKLEDKRLYTEW
jgi:hypothetical protein